MAFTTADMTTIQNAIMALVSGAEQVMINGRMYRKSSLAELRNLYDWLQGKTTLSASSSGIVRGTFGEITDQDDGR
jgi:hypothetical protein